jgi:hypothetical protein
MDPLINQINQLVQLVESLTEELNIADEIIDSIFEETDLVLADEADEILTEEKKKKKKWIQDAIKKPGALRKSLKVKAGKDIPVSKLEKAAEKGGKMGKRARLALTLRKLNK